MTSDWSTSFLGKAVGLVPPSLALLLFLAFSFGCGTAAKEPFPRQPTHPARGQVLVQGKKAEGVQLVFNPVSADGWKGPFPAAYTDAEGNFKVQTYATEDGAPAGKYVVTATWLAPGEGEERPDQLKGRYASTKSSPLQVEILPKDNQLKPFELQ